MGPSQCNLNIYCHDPILEVMTLVFIPPRQVSLSISQQHNMQSCGSQISISLYYIRIRRNNISFNNICLSNRKKLIIISKSLKTTLEQQITTSQLLIALSKGEEEEEQHDSSLLPTHMYRKRG